MTAADHEVDRGASATEARNLQWYRAGLLILIACAAFTAVPLVSGGRLLVPSFPTIALTPLLLLAVWPSLSHADVVFLLKIVFVLLLSIALSPGYEHVNAKMLALAQSGMAIGVAILMVRLMQQMRRETLGRTLLLLWVLIVTASILEVLGVIRDFSDTFRVWAYGAIDNIYDGDQRDISMVGWVRPKLFSVEPSHVTKFFVAAINSWFLVKVTWRKVCVVAGATLIMLLIMGSPMLLVSAAITLAILLWDQRVRIGSKVAMMLAILLIGVFFGLYYGTSTYSGIGDRLSTISEIPMERSDLGSEEQRIVYPYMVLADTLRRWPFFGVGIGGKDIVFENSKIRVGDADAAIGKNVMAEFFTSLGLVGGALFLFVWQGHLRKTGVHRLSLIAVIVALFSQLMGGMVTFRFWGFVALFWGVLAVADAQATEETTHLAGERPRHGTS